MAAKVVSAPAGAVREALSAAGRFAGDPVGTATGAVKFAMSLQRVLTPPDAPHSPALTGSGSGYRLDTFDVAFDELKAAGLLDSRPAGAVIAGNRGAEAANPDAPMEPQDSETGSSEEAEETVE